jgi:hypothetical protein
VRQPPLVGRLAAVAESAGAVLRRRRENREPRVRLRTGHGESLLVQPSVPGHERIVALAERLVADHARAGRGRR